MRDEFFTSQRRQERRFQDRIKEQEKHRKPRRLRGFARTDEIDEDIVQETLDQYGVRIKI